MNQTLRRLQIRQLHLSRVFTNGADIGVAKLMQCLAVLGGLSNELQTDVNLATGLLERFALAGDGVAWVFWLYATSWEFVVISCSLCVSNCEASFRRMSYAPFLTWMMQIWPSLMMRQRTALK